MNVRNASNPTESSAAGSWLDQIARSTLEGLLEKFRGDQITIRDSGQERTFGRDSSGRTPICVEVHHRRFYRQVMTGGSLGAAASFLDGDWSCDDLTGLIRIIVRNLNVARQMDSGWTKLSAIASRFIHWWRKNTRSGSLRNIEAHYDLGNDFFRLFLDETMMYSSGIFERPDSTLYEASVAKNDRICRQLDLRASDHLIEIGTGWGGFALHAAANYGCQITTTTISQEQFDLAQQRVKDAGLESRIRVVKQDYRDLSGQYDKLVSIEMIEAVGHQFFDTYFRKCSELLKPDGQMLVQAIVMNEQRYAEYLRSTDFIQRYVFPGGCLPSILAMGQSVAQTGDMRILHIEDFAAHYAQTLRCWRTRFWQAIDRVREQGFTERFIRLWQYYLCYCEAAFDERFVGVVQLHLAKAACRRDLIQNPPVQVQAPHDPARTWSQR